MLCGCGFVVVTHVPPLSGVCWWGRLCDCGRRAEGKSLCLLLLFCRESKTVLKIGLLFKKEVEIWKPGIKACLHLNKVKKYANLETGCRWSLW